VLGARQSGPRREHCIGEEREVHVLGLKRNSSEKKTYDRPTFNPMSISEVSALIYEEGSHHEKMLRTGKASTLTDGPMLLVEGCEGDMSTILQRIRAPVRESDPFSVFKGEKPVEMEFADAQGATWPETFLLLDLRDGHSGGLETFEFIEGNPNLGGALPMVILVTSLEQFHDWRGIDAAHCWQLRGRPSTTDLATALRSFLHLCAELAKWPSEERLALDKADKYDFISQINEE